MFLTTCGRYEEMLNCVSLTLSVSKSFVSLSSAYPQHILKVKICLKTGSYITIISLSLPHRLRDHIPVREQNIVAHMPWVCTRVYSGDFDCVQYTTHKPWVLSLHLVLWSKHRQTLQLCKGPNLQMQWVHKFFDTSWLCSWLCAWARVIERLKSILTVWNNYIHITNHTGWSKWEHKVSFYIRNE